MIIRSDNVNVACLKIFTNPTGDDYFITIYLKKDEYNAFGPVVKICGPGSGENLDVLEDIRVDLLKILAKLSDEK